jgi:KipI family sensor histidine kinase inhibitor
MSSKTLGTPIVQPYGDSAILVSYELGSYSEEACDSVHALADYLKGNGQWTNIIPAYDSAMFTFNPMEVSLEKAQNLVEKAVIGLNKVDIQNRKAPIDIPIFYGGDDGPDMERICASSCLTQDEVIQKHSNIIYRVCLMGFIPGFAFLSETDKALHHPRHDTPRPLVKPGSVGIANWQTGIYGLESPGGWQIIGRTPLIMFDKSRDKPFALEAGDRIRFVPQGHAS